MPPPTISLLSCPVPVEINLSHGGGEGCAPVSIFLQPLAGWPTSGSPTPTFAAGVECRPSAPKPCMRCILFPPCLLQTCPDSLSGPAASCVRPVVTGCDRAGPRAPARQMVVRTILCPCLEGREDQENQPNPGFPRNPSLAPLPLLSTVCSIFLPTHPPPNQHPLNRVYLQCTRTPGPRAPARQMVVRTMMCPCLEGREDQENQPN